MLYVYDLFRFTTGPTGRAGEIRYNCAGFTLINGIAMLARTNVATSVLQLLRRFAPDLPSLDEEASRTSLSDAGLNSMATVKLMLALEAEFNIAIPDEDLTPQNFGSLEAIVALVTRLRGY